nr:MAG TPA: hypothetical protein [Caudoviricetes sp.]
MGTLSHPFQKEGKDNGKAGKRIFICWSLHRQGRQLYPKGWNN